MKKVTVLLKNNFFMIFLSILIAVPVILPYFHSGYFPTHDGEWAVVRLADMFRELHDHQIPPRYSGVLNFEYGYPVFNFDYPGPYYIGMGFYVLKLGFVNSIKAVFVASVIFSAIGMYLFAKKLWNSPLAGLVCSALYVYFPYRIVDLYVRGSIGESVAFAVIPFLFLALYEIYEKHHWELWMGTGAFLYGLLIISHNIMAVLFSIPLGIFILTLSYKNRKSFPYLLSTLILGVLLSAFFSIPALVEKHYILLSKIPIADRSLYFVTIPQLLISPWGYGVPTDVQSAFTYQLGWAQIIGFCVAFGFILYSYKTKIKDTFSRSLTLTIGVECIGMILMMFSFTLPFWQHIPLLSEINYPWTLLGPLGFLTALLPGYFIRKNAITQIAAIALVILAVVTILPHAVPSSYVNRGDSYYMTNEATTTSSSEIMPLWVKTFPSVHPSNKVEFLKRTGNISGLSYNSKSLSVHIDGPYNTVLQVNTIYYPGWKAYIDGKEVKIQYTNDNGLISFPVPAGSHEITLSFSETPLRLTADMISIITALGIILFMIIRPSFILQKSMFPRLFPSKHKKNTKI